MKTVLLATALGLFVFSGMALADTTNVDKALCQKLATDYATDPSSLTLKEIAQLQYCLAQTWAQQSDTNPPGAPSNLGIQPESSSTGHVDTQPPPPRRGLRIQ